MKHLIISLVFLSALSVHAEVEYMNNDGKGAPETLDKAAGLTPEEAVTPPADAQEIQREEAESVEDTYLIGPYNDKGEYTFPNEDQKKKRRELQQEYFDE